MSLFSSPLQETHPKFSLTHLLENCVEMGNNQNQIAVVNERDEVIGVVTVSMLVKWLFQRSDLYKDALETPIWRIRPYNKVVTMDENAPAVDGFLKMAELGVGGIGITDKTGRLVDCLSSRDLRNIKPGSSRFSKLWSSCRAYKEAVINERVKTPSVSWKVTPRSVHRSTNDCLPLSLSQKPIAVKRSETLGSVLDKLCDKEHPVHRVFVCDDDGICGSVVS